MQYKIMNEVPFQILTSSISIGPSPTGYQLEVSADGKNFSPLFTVGANVTRQVTNLSSGSYYRLKGNEGQVVINWNRSCVTEGGEDLSDYYTKEETDAIIQSAITSGVSLDAYWTSAQTQSAITEAVSGKADAKILVDFDHTSQAERAALYADLYDLYDGGSGATINRNYDFYKTVNTWQGLKIDYYGFSGDTLVFGKVVSPENMEDQVVYEQVMTIDSLGNVEVVTNIVGGASGDMHMLEPVSEFPISADTGTVVALNAAGLPAGFTLVPTIITPDDGMDIPRSGVTLYAEFGAASGHNYDNLLNLFKINNVQVAVAQNEYHTEGIDLGNIDPEDDWFNIAVYMYIDSEYAGANSFIEGVDLEYAYTSQSDEGFEVTFFPSYNYDTGTLNPDITVEVSDDMGVFQYDGTDWVPVGGADMSAYWTSAQTEDAISAATSGKADAANVTANNNKYYYPAWNSQGVITGIIGGEFYLRSIKINGTDKIFPCYNFAGSLPAIYAPTTSGNPGEVLVADGTNTPKWSAVTMPDMSAYWTSAQTESAITAVENHLYDVEEVTASALTELHNSVLELSGRPTPDMTQYTPTSGFATVNGSAITNGGNIVIQGGGGGGGISQADLASSGYLYFNHDGMGNTETNLDDAYDFLKGNDGDGYSVDPPQLVDYDADEDGNMSQTYGHPPFPKHLVTIYRTDYDDLVNNGNEDSETFYIVLPDPE